MTGAGIDISAVLTAHREGLVAGVALRSMLDAMAHARDAGLHCELIIVLDRPDELTRDMFADAAEHGWKVSEVDFGDQGLARNHAISLCEGQYVAFNDADDLWSRNWLAEAHRLCESDPGRIIAHPEVNWFFQDSSNLFFHVDQTDPEFDPAMLRFINCWDALCMAPRQVFEKHPYSNRDMEAGLAYEDWQWNCETLEAGYLHRVVPGTIHFKRRRDGSQNVKAATRRALVRRTALFGYDWRPPERCEES